MNKQSIANNNHRAKSRDIKIPAIKDPIRRARAESDPIYFMKTYLPQWFIVEFSETHLKVINTFVNAINNNEKALAVLARSSGKTTIAKALLLWRIMTTPEQYVVLICASDKQAKLHMQSIKEELQFNTILCEDFPEVCEVFKRIGGSAIRANFITVHGKDANAVATASELRMPYSPTSKVYGNTLQITTIRSSFRGMNIRNAKSGLINRPNILLMDDIISDKSARSIDEQDNLEELVNAGVQNLAGHGHGMAILMCGTIINANDIIARFSNTEVNPQWHAQKFPAILQYPETWDSLWDQYFKIRFEEDKNNDSLHTKSNNFYKLNKVDMTKDFKVYWDIYDASTEIDCYQHWALKYYSIGKSAFATEYQHQPRQTAGPMFHIDPETVIKNLNNRQLFKTANDQNIITVGVDVNTNYGLSWVMLASSKTLCTSVIGHGVFATNGEYIYNAAKSEESEADCLKREMINLLDNLSEAPIYNMDNVKLKISAIAIDIGYMSTALQKLCLEIGTSKKYGETLIIPIRGRNEESHFSPKNVIKRGHNWAVVKIDNHTNFAPVLTTNADYWKENTQQSFYLDSKHDGAISINATKQSVFDWTEYSRQICNEMLMQKTYTGKCTKYIWRSISKNDLLDATSYARCIASYCGAINVTETKMDTLDKPAPTPHPIKSSNPIYNSTSYQHTTYGDGMDF